MKQTFRTLILAASATLALSACINFPYVAPVQQGNLIEADRLDLIRQGMSRNEIANAAGSPVLADIFHADRWDYIYFHKAGKDAPVQRKFALFFDANGKLEHSEPPLTELSTLPLSTL